MPLGWIACCCGDTCTAYTLGGAVTEIAGGGSATGWAGSGNVLNDTLFSSATNTLSITGTDETDKLLVDDFGFSIPTSATISSIRVEMGAQQTRNEVWLSFEHTNAYMRLRTPSGSSAWARREDSYGNVSNIWLNGEEASSPTDTLLWDLTPTPSDINSSSFGVEVYFDKDTVKDLQVTIPFIKVEVCYA